MAPLYFLGFLFIPLGAGLGYGYLAPGKENLVEGIVGGMLTGGVAGLIYGILQGLATSISVGFMDGLLATTTLTCIFGLGGIFFGAIGGVIWPQIQNFVE
jgi:hypothetical protein